jgi:hypothetical protein
LHAWKRSGQARRGSSVALGIDVPNGSTLAEITYLTSHRGT